MHTAAIDALRNEIAEVLTGQSDWLEAITVACPAGADKGAWQALVEELLFELHLDGVDVHVGNPTTEGPWILERHMGPGWA
jgi:hypothetical protein